MKLKELIKKAVPAEEVCLYTLGEEFDLYPTMNTDQGLLKSAWIKKWRKLSRQNLENDRNINFSFWIVTTF